MANLDAVVKELRQERDQLDKAIAALSSLDGSRPQSTRGRKTMSAAARARISAAQKRRWARAKGTPNTKAKRPSVRKHHISAAGIARIRAAAKARWAKVRAKQK